MNTQGKPCPLCYVFVPHCTSHACSKSVPYDPFPCPSCAAKDARIRELEEKLAVAEQSYSATKYILDIRESRLALAEKVVEAVEECAAGMVHPDGLELPPSRGDWERVVAALAAAKEG